MYENGSRYLAEKWLEREQNEMKEFDFPHHAPDHYNTYY